MIKNSWLLGAAMAAVAFSASAQSRESRVMISEPVQGYAYYNLPGATLEIHDREYADCAERVNLPAPTAMPLAMEWTWGSVFRGMAASAVENCMIAKGWRVFRLPEAEGRVVSRLSDAEFLTRFATMVGAAEPAGVLGRAWANQTLRPALYHTPSRVKAPHRDQLSIRAYGLSGQRPPLGEDPETPEHILPIRGQTLAETTLPGRGNAIILVRAVGSRVMGFERTLDTGGGVAFGLSGNRNGVWQAFEVPAGRWRINRTSWIIHCMGSPAFDVEPGEVVYAGSFDLAGQHMGPNLDLPDLSASLPADVSALVRPARYVNGTTVECPYGFGIYPLEFEGAPFVPGYRWGSMASQPQPAAAVD